MDFAYREIEAAFAFVCAGRLSSHQAFLDRQTGRVLLRSEQDAPGAIPAPTADGRFLALPGRVELHLGKSLVVSFVKERRPAALAEVYGMFCSRNAYVRFGEFLERAGLRGEWERHERDATERALRAWCREAGIALAD
jgi:hypothetical protein